MSEPRYPTRVSDPDETTRIPKEALEGLRDADKAREAGRPTNGSSSGATAAVPRPSEPATPPANGSSARPGASGFPSDGSPAVPAGSRTPLFGGAGSNGASGFRAEPGSGSVPAAGGLGSPGLGPPGAAGGSSGSGTSAGSAGSGLGSAGSYGSGLGSAGSHGSRPGSSGAAGGSPGIGAPGSPPVSSPIGYPERSQTGYSPAAYQGAYSSAYPSVADAPTTVSGPGSAGPSGARLGAGVAGAGLGAGATAAARSSLGTGSRPPAPARGAAGGGRPPRRARLLVRHIDPWSTLKFSFVLSVAMFFVWLVAVGVLYGVLDGMGVFEQINGLYDEVSGEAGDTLFSPGLVLGSATVVGAINIVLFTALATIGAFVYNICSDLVGGIEVTLAERD